MLPEPECDQCKALLDSASLAIARHLQAIARLDLARIRHEIDLLPSLETVVRETGLSRENAVSAYKYHRSTHYVERAGPAA